MNIWIERTTSGYGMLVRYMESLTPLLLLLFRIYVAVAFWRAGVVKWDDPSGTHYLFAYEYNVPILSAGIAAFLATWVELITPWLLGLGIAGRLTAIFVFVYNIIAVVSYPDLWPNGFWNGLVGNAFSDHKAWALLLLAIAIWGPGRWSVDTLIGRLWRRPVRQ